MCAADRGVGRVVARLRRDAYTGDDRCWPCTVANAGLLGITVAAVWWIVAPPVAGGVALVGLAAIWFRGYLIPYTPHVTARLLDRFPGNRGPHSVPPAPPRDGSRTDENRVDTDGSGTTGASDAFAESTDVLSTLVAVGVLDVNGDEVSLATPFHEAWREVIESTKEVESDPEALADTLSETVDWVAGASVVTDDGRTWIRLTDDQDRIVNETWLSIPAALSDLTALRTLDRRTDLDTHERTLVAPALRQFLERCPACGEQLEVTSPRACCGSPQYVEKGIEAILACPDCDAVVTTFEATDESA